MERRPRIDHRKRQDVADLDDILYGVHAVGEALAAGEKLRKLHVADDRKRDPVVRRLLDEAKALDVLVRFEDRGFFSRFPYKAHQGIVGYGQPFPYTTVEEIMGNPERSSPLLVVLLDHITDPHNAGAIIRTAECAGAHGVVLPERRSAGVNATVRKAAAGAAAHLPVARVSNIAQTIRMLKKAGVWIFGADLGPESVSLTEADFSRDAALVIGAEGEGLSQLVRRECDYLVRIPMLGKVESLNASVATGVLLYEAVRQRRAALVGKPA
ncbi:MAG: 23S rRNA (guanosine(2251)-2'-O)-methyltransferase RlmB [Candidatus Eremiobacteraeota bacterium]|nr:23S rRNA (guanosine(2251)-2'-O)-methyltransferase RlmB [Candidatus Eremiobacteraeota bacterium]